MMNIDKLGRRGRRLGALAMLLAAGGGLTGCENFLQATNPGAVEEYELDDASYLNVLVNGVLGYFQPAVNNFAHYGGVFTDELSSSHVFRENQALDRRAVDADNGTAASIYTYLQRSRFMADTVAGRIQVMLGDSAQRDLRLARTLALAGYSYGLLGEAMCSAPINKSVPKTPEELQTIAVQRFEAAIASAQAVKAHYTSATPQSNTTRRLAAGADSVLNLARVGAARAALNKGDHALAVQYASQVPAGFVYQIHYAENDLDGSIDNVFYNVASSETGSGSRSINIAFTPFEAMADDPRVPRQLERVASWTGDYPVPKTTRVYSNWSPDRTVDWARSVSMELASGLEARYILAEAGGMSEAELLAFVNERRAVGEQGSIVASGAALRAELRDQRARDFFLGARRLGDLRRYQDQYGVDLWQYGDIPHTTTGEQYGEQFCLPLPRAELDGNPNAG